MRGVITSSALFLVIVIFMIFSGFGLEKVGKEMCNGIDNIKESVEKEEWSSVKKHIERLKERWEKNEKWVTMFVDHRETDEINRNLYALEEYVKYKEVPELMATAAMLKQLFKHIPEKERPVPKNIL